MSKAKFVNFLQIWPPEKDEYNNIIWAMYLYIAHAVSPLWQFWLRLNLAVAQEDEKGLKKDIFGHFFNFWNADLGQRVIQKYNTCQLHGHMC